MMGRALAFAFILLLLISISDAQLTGRKRPTVKITANCTDEPVIFDVNSNGVTTLRVVRLLAGQPSTLVYNTTFSYDATVSFTPAEKGDYEVTVFGGSISSLTMQFSITCPHVEAPPAPPITPPAPPAANQTPPAAPPQPPPADQKKLDANAAIDAAYAAITAAAQGGRDAYAATRLLSDATAAFNSGSYDNALSYAKEAKALADSAPTLQKPQAQQPAAPPKQPAQQPQPEQAQDYSWLATVGLIALVLAAIAYSARKFSQ